MFCVCLIVRPGRHPSRHRILEYLSAKELLYALEEIDVLLCYERYCHAVALSTGRTTNAMNVVLYVVGHIIVDDHLYVIDVYTAGHDICCYQHIDLARLETVHHLVTLGLCEV